MTSAFNYTAADSSFGDRLRTALAHAELKIYCLDEVTSTMDFARRLCSGALQADGFCFSSDTNSLILARAQTQGRGRNNREWYSERDRGIYVTYLLHSSIASNALLGFTPAMGLAVHKTVQAFSVQASLKWPNDLLLRTGSGESYNKLAGLLTEHYCSADGTDFLSLGVGLNLCSNKDSVGISLEDILGSAPDRLQLLVELSHNILNFSERYFECGFCAFKEQWNKASMMPGERVRLGVEHGGLIGKVRGVDDCGRLMVETQQGGEDCLAVFSGEVELLDVTCS